MENKEYAKMSFWWALWLVFMFGHQDDENDDELPHDKAPAADLPQSDTEDLFGAGDQGVNRIMGG